MHSLERQLRLAALALQEKIVTPAAMIAALQKLSADTDQNLLDRLIDSEGLAAVERSRLEGLAGETPTKSFADSPAPTVSFIEGGSARTTDVKVDWEPPRPNVRFRPIRLYARGGLGQVSLAQDNEIPREVALKQIVPGRADDPATQRRFVREAEITGQLEHPGIVPVYGLGTTPDGRPYYAMRLIRGETLLDHIEAFHRRPARDFGGREFRQLLSRFASVCQAIQYAHDRGVIHRDIKPQNIMLGAYGETLVVDWGLAKGTTDVDAPTPLAPVTLSVQDQTLDGATFGTPAYMSREQWSGNIKTVGPRSDVYSLGATLYCLLTGRPPYQSGQVDVLIARLKNDVPSPRSLVANVPRPLGAICLRAMSPCPEDRYAKATDLAQDIENWLADEKVTVHRESVVERGSRWLRKHRTLASVSVVATVIVLISLAIGSAVLATKNQQLALANQKEQQATRTAEFRLGQVEKANHVLVEIFYDLNPIGEQKHRPLAETLALRLVRAGEELQQEVSGDPLTIAKMQNALGVTLQSLDFALEAEKLHLLAKATRERELGAQHQETLQSAHNLAMAWRARGDLKQALPLLESTLAEQRKSLGPNHEETLSTQASLAGALNEAGQSKRAIELFADALERRKKTSGPKNLATLMVMSNLAGAYESAGNLSQAIELYEIAERDARQNFGESHSVVAQIQNNLGYAYKQIGRVPEALQFYQKSWQSSQDKFGTNHPDTLQAQAYYASALSAVGKANEALPLHAAAVQGLTVRFGENHPTTLSVQQALAYDYLQLSQPEQAIPLLEKVLKERTAIRGSQHPETLRTMAGLAGAYADLGKNAAALRLLESASRTQAQVLGADHPDALQTNNKLAEVYAELQQWDKALPLFETIILERTKEHGPDHPLTLTSKSNLATALVHSGKLAEGAALCEQVLQLQRAKIGAQDIETLRTQNNLADAYLRAWRHDRAEPLLRDAIEKMDAALGIAHSHTLLARNNLGLCLVELNRAAEAVPVFEDVLSRMQANRDEDHPEVLLVEHNLAGAYCAAGQTEEGIALYFSVIARSELVFGPAHVRTLTSKDRLASVYLRQKKPKDAIPLLLEVWEARQTAHGDADDGALQARSELAGAYMQAGEQAAALKHNEAIFQQREKHSGRLDPSVLKSLNQLAVNHQQLQQYERSLELLHDLVARQAEVQDISPDQFWLVRLNLVNAHLGLKQWNDADMYLQQLQAALDDKSIALSPSFRTVLKQQVSTNKAQVEKERRAEPQK